LTFFEGCAINQNKRIIEIEYLRGFAILAVLAIHTSSNLIHIQNVNLLLITNVVIDVFSHFAVPLFIFISGFVLPIKYDSSLSKKAFYKKRVLSILPPYIIFSIVYICIHTIGHWRTNGILEYPSLTNTLFWILTASSAFHMWFFALVIQFYIIYPYIIYLYEKYSLKKQLILLLIVTFLVQEGWLVSRNIYQTYSNPTIDLLLASVFLSHIFYFILGIYTYHNYENMKKDVLENKKLLSVLVLLFTVVISIFWIKGIIEYGNFSKIPTYFFIIPDLIGTVYFSLIFLLLLMSIINLKSSNRISSNILLSLGNYSFGIYLIHVVYMNIIINILFPKVNIDVNQSLYYILLFLLTLILSYINIYIITLFPYHKIFIGEIIRKSKS
jgi:peptidoglycan/LPS O-acetylase OafA/YrhL